jgi:hypothetical protein
MSILDEIDVPDTPARLDTGLPERLAQGAVDLSYSTRHSSGDLLAAAETLWRNDMPDPLKILRDLAGITLGPASWAATNLVNVCADYRQEAERLADENRRYWSGPNKAERQWYRVSALPMAERMGPPSALDARYHRRYRNRQGRR